MDEPTQRLDAWRVALRPWLDAVRHAWRVALRPWLDALRSSELRIPSPTDMGDGETLTLDVPEWREETPIGWTLFFEAIELLDLLARVDVRLAWLLLLEAGSYGEMRYEDLPDRFADKFPRFRLDALDNVLYPLLLDEPSPSPDYDRVKQEATEEWSLTHHGRVFNRHEQGHVKLKLRINLDLIQDVPRRPGVEATDEDASLARDPAPSESPFEIESCEVRLVGTHLKQPVNSEAVSTFRYLKLDHVLEYYASEESVVQCVGKRPQGGWSGLYSVALSAWSIAPGSIRETFLGIALTPRIRKLKIQWSPVAVRDAADAQSWWSWLTCAFFSRAFDHNVDTLSLTVGKLRLSEVAVMRRILSHQDPLTLLTSEDGQGGSLETAEKPRLASDDATVSGPVHHRVLHLSLIDIDIEEESIQATVEFLRLIGGPVESLSIESKFNRVLDQGFFTELLVSCPNLTRLELNSVHLKSVDWLVDSPTPLHLETLFIQVEDETVEHQVAWPCLFDALSDRNHPLSRSLRRLVLASHYSYTTVTVLDAIYRQCLAMLGKNDRLHNCQVECCNLTLMERYKDRFRSFHGSLLVEVVQARLAFCSVVSPQEPAIVPSALHRLSTENVQSILAFAVKAQRRVCFIDC